MQYPAEIPGVTNAEFIRSAINARLPKDEPISIRKYLKDLEETMDFLDMPFSDGRTLPSMKASGGGKETQ